MVNLFFYSNLILIATNVQNWILLVIIFFLIVPFIELPYLGNDNFYKLDLSSIKHL